VNSFHLDRSVAVRCGYQILKEGECPFGFTSGEDPKGAGG
jgi:hypothetical protein